MLSPVSAVRGGRTRAHPRTAGTPARGYDVTRKTSFRKCMLFCLHFSVGLHFFWCTFTQEEDIPVYSALCYIVTEMYNFVYYPCTR